jgi:hypothetical protein
MSNYDTNLSDTLNRLLSTQLSILDRLGGWLKTFEGKFSHRSPRLIGRSIRLPDFSMLFA